MFCDGIVAFVTDSSFTCDRSLSEGANTIVASTSDIAGNEATTSINVTLAPADAEPPTLSIISPVAGGIVIEDQPNIEVSFSDPGGVDTSTLAFTNNGNPITVECTLSETDGSCRPTTPLPEGLNTLVAMINGTAGNKATTQIDFTIDTAPAEIKITSPGDELVTKNGEIQVIGDAGPGVNSVTINGVPANLGNTFSATVPLREGTNMIVAVATKASGRTGTDSIEVTRDIAAPIVKVTSPRDGFVSVEDAVTVTGQVNDIVNGATNPLVLVNGVEATVANGAFMVVDLPLVRRPNTIEAVATDAVGNVGRDSISVTFQPPVGARLNLFSGNGQAGLVKDTLPEPLVVVVKDDLSNPVAGRVVL